MSNPIEPGATVGVVGLGQMGDPMTRQLIAAGYRVRGYDADDEQRARFDSVGDARATEHLSEVSAGADAVILLLPSSGAVRQVLIEDGLLETIEPGAVVIDMGSSDPLQTQALAAEAAASHITLIDAPVSGGVVGAESRALTIMVGSSEEVYARCRPIFHALGSTVMHVGPVGAGHALKALNNLLSAASMLATSEALLVGERFGLQPEEMLAAINVSSGRSFSTEFKFPRFVLPATFASGFKLKLMAKDARTAVELGAALGVPLEFSALLADLWEQAAKELPDDADHTQIAAWVSQSTEAE